MEKSNRRFSPRWSRCLAAAVVFLAAVCAPGVAVAQRVFYAHAVTGNDLNSGLTPAAPKKTIMGTAGVMAAGFATQAGDTLRLAGAFHPLKDVATTWGDVDQAWKINAGAGHILTNLTIEQWPGMPQAIICGEVAVSVASGWTFVANGVFEITIPAGTVAWWNNGGTHRTLTEGVVDVAIDIARNFDIDGRPYGHLKWMSSAANVNSTDNSWFFTPNAPAGSGGGGGTLRVNFGDAGLTNTTQLAAWGADSDGAGADVEHTVTICYGNVCPIEIGTPTYQNGVGYNPSTNGYPTWGAYSGVNVVNLKVDGLGFWQWLDSGYRQNKPTGSGVGDDSSAYGAGNVVGVVSTGYPRFADCTNSIISNCWSVEGGGYHAFTWAGDRCTYNTYRDIFVSGGAGQTFSGGTSTVFYVGPGLGSNNDIVGCRGENMVLHVYTMLGRDGKPIPFPRDGSDAGTAAANGYPTVYDGFIAHTNGRAGTSTSVTDGGSTAVFASAGMFAGETIVVTSSSTPNSLVGSWTLSSGGGTFSIPIDPGGSGNATWYSTSNVVRDIELSNVHVKMFPDTFTTSLGTSYHKGQAVVGGHRAIPPADILDWSKYPVRVKDSLFEDVITNVTSLNDYIAFQNCAFDMPRSGIATPTGTVLGSNSGENIMAFFGCSIAVNLGNPAGTARSLFALNFDDSPNKIVLVNSGVYNRQTPGETNLQSIVEMQNDTAGVISSLLPGRISGYGNIVGHEYCRSTLHSNIAVDRNLVRTGIVWDNVDGGGDSGAGDDGNPGVPLAWRDNTYFNIQTDRFILFGGGALNYGPQANYAAAVDPNGVYRGQDPTPAQFAAGNPMVNPFVEWGGGSLRPTPSMMSITKYLPTHVNFGFAADFGRGAGSGMGGAYSGHYGPWQFGPTPAVIRAPVRNRPRRSSPQRHRGTEKRRRGGGENKGNRAYKSYRTYKSYALA